MTTPFLYTPTFAPVFNGASVPNGLLYTYVAGSTNPKSTFADPGGIFPNSNPVQLDITGAATVRLEPGAYHFVLTDATGTTVLWDQDFYTAPYLTAADIAALLSPQSFAEALLSVTPIDLTYPVGHVYRYGKNPQPGATDMTAAINTATRVCRQGGHECLVPTYDVLFVTASLNFSGVVARFLGNPFGGTGCIRASSAQFDVITSTGLMILFNPSVDGGWDGVTKFQLGDILSLTSGPGTHPYVNAIYNPNFTNAKRNAIYIERGGYTDIYHPHCLNAGLNSLECFGTQAEQCTTIRVIGSGQLGGTPNGYGIKTTECTKCSFEAILEDTQGISLNGLDNRALMFDIYQENFTAGINPTGFFVTDNGGGIGLTFRTCFGGNLSMPTFTNWQNLYYQGNSNLAQGPIPLANRIFTSGPAAGTIAATGDVTVAQLSLSPGTYRLTGTVQTIISTGGGTATQLACQITTSSGASGLANSTSSFVEGAAQTQSFGASQDGRISCFTEVQVTATTLYYLRAHIALSGTITEGYNGILRAELIE